MRLLRPGTLRGALGAAAASAVLLLAGCTTAESPSGGSGEGGGLSANVDVDTPDLRAAREQAALAECPEVPSTDPASWRI